MSNTSFEEDFDKFRGGFDRTVVPVLLVLLKTATKSRHNFLSLLKKRFERIGTEFDEVRYYSHLLPLLNDLFVDFEDVAKTTDSKVWVDRIQVGTQNWIETLPNSGLYPQNDVCFVSESEDRPYVRLGKYFKRTRHKLDSLLVSKTSKEQDGVLFPGWNHSVKWEQASHIIQNELYREVRRILTDEWKSRSVLADLLVEICDLQHSNDALAEILLKIDQFKEEITQTEANQKKELNQFVSAAMNELALHLEYFGTFQENKKLTDPIKNTKKLQKQKSKIIGLEEKWVADYKTRLSQLSIDIGLHQFNQSVNQTIQSLDRDIRSVLDQMIASSANQTQVFLEKLADEFESVGTTKTKQLSLKQKILKAEKHSFDYFQNEFTLVIQKAVNELDLSGLLEQSFSSILLTDELLPASAQVFNSSEKVVEMPVYDVIDLSFRSELTTFLKHDLFRKLRKLPKPIQDELESISSDADEVVEIVQVNLNLASNLLQSDESEEDRNKVLALIHDGLDRAAKRAGEISTKATKLSQSIQELILQPAHSYIDLCNDIMLRDRYLYIRTKNKEAQVLSAAIDWKARLTSSWFKFVDILFVRQRYLIRTGGSALNRLRRTLGFNVEDERSGYIQPGAAEFLAETEIKLAELPLIYRKLFSNEALNDERFYKGRHTVTSLFEDSYRQWSKEHFSNFVIIGEKGSGKTSCLKIVPQKIKLDHEIISGVIEKTTWTEADIIRRLSEILQLGSITDRNELISKINESPKRRIVFLEGFQNMYLRTIQGFEALESFLLVLSQTGNRIFWVVTSSKYGWEYLNKIYQTSGFFTHLRKIDNVSADVIEDIIMSRHKVSGYDLVFKPSQEMRSSRAYKKTEADPLENQRLVRDDFFKSLSNIAEGNISIALQYWLRSIQNTGLDVIEIAPFKNVQVTLGDGFTHDDLFTLGALVLHDDLNHTQLAKVLNTNEKDSRLILSKLHARSILVRIDERYYLNQLLYRHVVNMLKSKNIIH
jgi:hypothetical protein